MKAVMVMPVDFISGAMSKQPGLVGFNWRGLQVFRGWVKPRNPQSADQVSIRNILTQCSQGFQGITLTQKANWDTYGTIRPSVFYGKDIPIPAISAYVKVNTFRLIDGVAIDDEAPTALVDFVASDISTVAYNSGTTVLSFDVSHNATVVTGKLWVIKITATLPSAVYGVRKGDYRLCKGVDTASIIPVTASPQSVSITAPLFGNWGNGDPMSIQLLPLSPDYDLGSAYSEINNITVT